MKKLLNIFLYLVVAVLIGITVSYAGTLTPPGAPAKTMKTLGNLYELINTGANTPSVDFSTPGTISATMNSLGDVYDLMTTKIAAIDGTQILTGTSIFGVAGSASAGADLSNMFNGTGQAITGGSQANGGIDDSNHAGVPSTSRYTASWTACNVGNSYCGTSDAGADAKDNASGLVWSKPCNGVGCSSFSDTLPVAYTWNDAGGSNNSLEAPQLCTGHSGWYLPHQKQLMMAYLDGSYGNLEAQGVIDDYWSATTSSFNTNLKFVVDLGYGYTDTYQQSSTAYVRCVR